MHGRWQTGREASLFRSVNAASWASLTQWTRFLRDLLLCVRALVVQRFHCNASQSNGVVSTAASELHVVHIRVNRRCVVVPCKLEHVTKALDLRTHLKSIASLFPLRRPHLQNLTTSHVTQTSQNAGAILLSHRRVSWSVPLPAHVNS